MDCVQCKPKHCRSTVSCGAETFSKEELAVEYKSGFNKQVIENAALLVDNGRAGELSRLQEIIEFVKTQQYERVGLAYCYGMETSAKKLKDIFRSEGIKLITVSCTVGGIPQSEINLQSSIPKVSCNPLGQARQLETENVQFVIMMGICLGHDIILQKNLKVDFTTFAVKDRVYNHQPLLALDNFPDKVLSN